MLRQHADVTTTVHLLASIGTGFGLAGAVSLLLQARTLLRLGTACEISVPLRLVSAIGYAVWLAYGIAIRDLPLILVDAAGLAAAIFVLRITMRLRRMRPCPSR